MISCPNSHFLILWELAPPDARHGFDDVRSGGRPAAGAFDIAQPRGDDRGRGARGAFARCLRWPAALPGVCTNATRQRGDRDGSGGAW